jgi:hemin uptake protein HemP
MNTKNVERTIDIVNNAIKSALLLGQNKELIIEHNDELYRLRITGNGKLILTK